MVSIYALCCPDSGVVKYIGKANNPAARMKSHLRDANRRSTPVYCWIRSLLMEGKLPAMKVLSVVASENWQEEDRRLIALYRLDGNLKNIADGGDEPYCDIEVRRANGRKVAAIRVISPLQARIWSHKRALCAALKAGELKERHIDAMRNAARIAPAVFGLWAGI